MKKMLMNQMVVLGSVLLFTCLTMVFMGCVPKTIPVPKDKPKQESKIISPDDFKSMMIGKTKIEVKEIMGRSPDHVMQNYMNNDPTGVWTYMAYRSKITAKGRYIYDPIVGKDVKSVIIYFTNEQAEKTDISF